MLDPLYNAIGWLLSIYYSLIPNLGISIILLTFTIMLLLYPLTAKQAKSMIRMQMVQPEIKRIQAKYKNDRAKLNEEMMKFYQENKINPLAGCLPLLVQMPIFFALFNVLRNAYKYVPESSSLYKALCTNASDVVVGVSQCGKDPLPNPKSFLGMNLSLSAPDQLTTWASILAFSLVVLVMFTGYMQSRQAQKRTPAINKQMAFITKALPVFFGFISLNFPSGLVLYFFVSNLWRLGQQEVIFRRFGSAADPKHKSLLSPPKATVVDADSRDVTEDGDAAAADAKSPGKGTPAGTKPGTGSKGGGGAKVDGRPSAAASGGKPVVPPQRSGGGLRSLFQLPPPPGDAPKPKPAAGKPTTTRKPTTSSTPSSRPGEAGRRTSKKKKKR